MSFGDGILEDQNPPYSDQTLILHPFVPRVPLRDALFRKHRGVGRPPGCDQSFNSVRFNYPAAASIFAPTGNETVNSDPAPSALCNVTRPP